MVDNPVIRMIREECSEMYAMILNYFVPFHAARFTHVDDLKWFTKTMGRVIGEECGEMYVSYVDETHYFVDFLRYSKGLFAYILPHPPNAVVPYCFHC